MELLDEASGEKYLQSSIEVNKDEVEPVGAETGGYWCECHAWNSQGSSVGDAQPPKSALSRRGLVQIASE